MIWRGGCGGGVRRGEGCGWLGFCEGPSVGEKAPEPGRIEVKAELEAEDGCEMLPFSTTMLQNSWRWGQETHS
jgi:hypothetical protein